MFAERTVATVVALGLAITTAVAIGVTATEATTAVTPLVTVGVIVHGIFLLVGSVRWVGVSSAAMVAAIVIEAGFADQPSWIRSILLGCLWFVTMEVSWETIERRNGARHTRAVNERRVYEVVTVLALSLVISLGAIAATEIAPVRSVFLQALVLGGLLSAFVALVRSAARPRRGSGSSTEATDAADVVF